VTKGNLLFFARVALGLCLVSVSNAQPTNAPFKIEVYDPVSLDTSPPLRDIGPPHEVAGRRNLPLLRPGVISDRSTVADPVVQVSATALSTAASPNNFDGIPATPFPCPTPEDPNKQCVAAPPDENLAVGPNHILQTVNVHFAIWDKSGNLLAGPTPNNAIWAGHGGACETHNDGDPIVRYDQISNRWLFTQLAADTGTSTFYECIAVSTSGDPAGSYYRYTFNFGFRFQDYPKFGVWPDAYYMSANSFVLGFLFEGANLCAFDRSKMLIGAPAQGICVLTSSLYSSQLPSDLDGATLPPNNAPNPFVGLYTTSPGYLAMFRMKPDFVNTSATQVTGPFYIPVSAFNLPCGNGGDCIPQLGTTQLLSSIGDRLMHRLAYRNLGTHESLVMNHSVAANNTVGTRWYEIRNPNGTPVVNQEGTYTPDSNYRWMGSIAMDQSGNIGLGYSESGPGMYPGIYFAGRETSDPLGQLSAEQLVWAGSGSQDGLNRWGDYSAMEVDPTDDCTFWYTSQYLPATGSFNWHTRIASFKFSSCGASPPPKTNTTTAITSHSPNPSVTGQAYSVSVTVSPVSGSGTPSGNVTVNDGAGANCVVTLSGGSGSCSLTAATAVARTLTATYGGDASFNGSTSPPVNHTVNKADTTTTITGDSPDPSTTGQAYTVNFTVVANAPGAGSPTGTVTVSDATGASCSASVAAGSCSITSTSAGSKTLTASYPGDGNFNPSSGTAPHTVNASATVPTAPSNLTATAIYSGTGRNKQFQHVSLGWSDNSNNESNFAIERCTVIGKGQSATCGFGPLITLGANVTSYNDSSPTKGKYRYRVKATNGSGSSGYSNQAEVIVQ
jgi:Big-like domain-containing protein